MIPLDSAAGAIISVGKPLIAAYVIAMLIKLVFRK